MYIIPELEKDLANLKSSFEPMLHCIKSKSLDLLVNNWQSLIIIFVIGFSFIKAYNSVACFVRKHVKSEILLNLFKRKEKSSIVEFELKNLCNETNVTSTRYAEGPSAPIQIISARNPFVNDITFEQRRLDFDQIENTPPKPSVLKA